MDPLSRLLNNGFEDVKDESASIETAVSVGHLMLNDL